jgi:hypothetical protein
VNWVGGKFLTKIRCEAGRILKSGRRRKTGKSKAAVEKAVEKVGNTRKCVERIRLAAAHRLNQRCYEISNIGRREDGSAAAFQWNRNDSLSPSPYPRFGRADRLRYRILISTPRLVHSKARPLQGSVEMSIDEGSSEASLAASWNNVRRLAKASCCSRRSKLRIPGL